MKKTECHYHWLIRRVSHILQNFLSDVWSLLEKCFPLIFEFRCNLWNNPLLSSIIFVETRIYHKLFLPMDGCRIHVIKLVLSDSYFNKWHKFRIFLFAVQYRLSFLAKILCLLRDANSQLFHHVLHVFLLLLSGAFFMVWWLSSFWKIYRLTP